MKFSRTLRGKQYIKAAAGKVAFSLLLYYYVAAPCGGEEWKRTSAGRRAISACAAWECDIIRITAFPCMFPNVICIIPFLVQLWGGREFVCRDA